MYKVYFITFGCKVNHYETECMKSLFRESGYEIVEEMTEADAVVINSCTVTSSGDSRALAALRKARAAMPQAVIALTGCYPQANREEAAKLPEADIIAGTKNRAHIAELAQLPVGDGVNAHRILHDARIRHQEAGDVRPVFIDIRMDRTGNNGTGHIGATAGEGVDRPVRQ